MVKLKTLIVKNLVPIYNLSKTVEDKDLYVESNMIINVDMYQKKIKVIQLNSNKQTNNITEYDVTLYHINKYGNTDIVIYRNIDFKETLKFFFELSLILGFSVFNHNYLLNQPVQETDDHIVSINNHYFKDLTYSSNEILIGIDDKIGYPIVLDIEDHKSLIKYYIFTDTLEQQDMAVNIFKNQFDSNITRNITYLERMKII